MFNHQKPVFIWKDIVLLLLFLTLLFYVTRITFKKQDEFHENFHFPVIVTITTFEDESPTMLVLKNKNI